MGPPAKTKCILLASVQDSLVRKQTYFTRKLTLDFRTASSSSVLSILLLISNRTLRDYYSTHFQRNTAKKHNIVMSEMELGQLVAPNFLLRNTTL